MATCAPNIFIPASQVESENPTSKDKPKKKGFARCIKRMTRTFRTSKTSKKSANLDDNVSIATNPLEKQVPSNTDNKEERKVSFEEAHGDSKEKTNICDRLGKNVKEEENSKTDQNEKISSTEYQDSPKSSSTKSRFHIICSHNDLHTFDLMQKNSRKPLRYTGSIKYDGPKSIGRILHEERNANERKGTIKNESMKEMKFSKDERLNFECSSFIDVSESHTR